MIITVVAGSPLPPRDRVAAVLEAGFGAGTVASAAADPPGAPADYRVTIDPPDGPRFEAWGMTSGALHLDGVPAQNARAAALVAAIATAGDRVVAVDPDRSAFVELFPGITPEQIAVGWRDLAEGGF